MTLHRDYSVGVVSHEAVSAALRSAVDLYNGPGHVQFDGQSLSYTALQAGDVMTPLVFEIPVVSNEPSERAGLISAGLSAESGIGSGEAGGSLLIPAQDEPEQDSPSADTDAADEHVSDADQDQAPKDDVVSAVLQDLLDWLQHNGRA